VKAVLDFMAADHGNKSFHKGRSIQWWISFH